MSSRTLSTALLLAGGAVIGVAGSMRVAVLAVALAAPLLLIGAKRASALALAAVLAATLAGVRIDTPAQRPHRIEHLP